MSDSSQAAPTPAASTPRSATENRLERFLAEPKKALWTLAMPILIGMSVQTLYMVVDMVFVGQVSGEALTALAFNMPVLFFTMGACFGVGSGVTALIAQAVGARDRARATSLAEQSLLLGVVLAACFMVPGLLFGSQILTLLGVPPELLADAWGYLSIQLLGLPFMMLAVLLRSMLSGEGDMRLPVTLQMIATLINISLDPLFIFTFGLGVRGAALATLIAQAFVALALTYVLLVRRRSFVELRVRWVRLEPAVLASILRIGAPASLSMIVMSIGGAAFNRILVADSAAAVAAHQIGGRLDAVVILPMVAVASSLVTLVGMYHGAGRRDLLRAIVRYALVRAIALGTLIGALSYLFAPTVVTIFTNDPAIRELAVRYARTLAFAYPFMPISMLAGRVLQGLGRGTPELLLSLLRVVLVAVPLAWLTTFVLHRPAHWVWLAMVAGSLVSAATGASWLRGALRRTEVDTA
jgi:putative MATE family efflux protein